MEHRGRIIRAVAHSNDVSHQRPIVPQRGTDRRKIRVWISGLVGYSDKHGGVFMSQGLRMHVHFVSRDSNATGHIDAIAPADLVLRIPRG